MYVYQMVSAVIFFKQEHTTINGTSYATSQYIEKNPLKFL